VRIIERDVAFADTDINIEQPEQQFAQAKNSRLPRQNQINRNSACDKRPMICRQAMRY